MQVCRRFPSFAALFLRVLLLAIATHAANTFTISVGLVCALKSTTKFTVCSGRINRHTQRPNGWRPWAALSWLVRPRSVFFLSSLFVAHVISVLLLLFSPEPRPQQARPDRLNLSSTLGVLVAFSFIWTRMQRRRRLCVR